MLASTLLTMPTMVNAVQAQNTENQVTTYVTLSSCDDIPGQRVEVSGIIVVDGDITCDVRKVGEVTGNIVCQNARMSPSRVSINLVIDTVGSDSSVASTSRKFISR